MLGLSSIQANGRLSRVWGRVEKKTIMKTSKSTQNPTQNFLGRVPKSVEWCSWNFPKRLRLRFRGCWWWTGDYEVCRCSGQRVTSLFMTSVKNHEVNVIFVDDVIGAGTFVVTSSDVMARVG